MSIFTINPLCTNAKPPYLNFLATVLSLLRSHLFFNKKPNLAQMKQEFKYLRAQWHDQTKIVDGSNHLILGEQEYFV